MSEHTSSWMKVGAAWIGALVGAVTLSQVALLLTIVFTTLQIYKLIREFRRERRLEKFEAKLKHEEESL